MPTLRQDFDADFTAITAGLSRDYAGPPYALVRYADGEAAVAFGRAHVAQSDGWIWKPGRRNLLSDGLLDSLAYSALGWHVGVTAESHHAKYHHELLRYVNVPMDRVTFAEIFIFANWRRFIELDVSHCLTVGPHGDYYVPPHGVENGWLWHGLAEQLIEEANAPILVAAGPLAKVLIYEYWRRSAVCPERRQVILDVGSALKLSPRYLRRLSPRYLRRKKKGTKDQYQIAGLRSWITRRYQRCEDPTYGFRPEWKLTESSPDSDTPAG